MSKIQILTTIPSILTKDEEWIKYTAPNVTIQEGSIVLLPEDAVLVIPPTLTNITLDKYKRYE